MDILVYISDLLTKKGSLVVPGLGSFSRIRTDGYYDKEQQLFYPPAILLQYKPETDDDDSLSQYIATNRAISPASARYFIEKYVSNLKEQAASEGAEFGNFGVFYLRKNQLAFVPTSSAQNNELFYGLAPVILKRNSAYRKQAFAQTPVATPEPVHEQSTLPVFELPVTGPPTMPEPPVLKPADTEPPVAEPVRPMISALPKAETPKPAEEPPYRPPSAMPRPVPATERIVAPKPELTVVENEIEEEEEKPRRKVNAWLIVAIIIVALGLGLIAAYQFKPALFDKILSMGGITQKPVQTQAPVIHQAPKPTIPLDSAQAFALIAKNYHNGDTIKLLLGAEIYNSFYEAQTHLDYYRNLHFSPGVIKNATGKYQVYSGHYFEPETAQAAFGEAKIILKNAPITPTLYPHRKK